MFLIVGLGNPGEKYKNTRHNIGFRVLDELQRKNRDTSIFSDFKLGKKFNSLISEGIFNDEKIILAKPQTFMNNSGRAVKSLINFCKITRPGRVYTTRTVLVVVHDDIDLPLGKIRIAAGRGAAGHKGVESIIRELKTKDFVRFRIGILPKTGKPKNPENFVLQKFNKDEEKIVKEVVQKTSEAIEIVLKEGIEKAMSKFNR